MQRQKRPCTNRWRTAADDPQEAYGLMQDPWKEPGWTASRCAGELSVVRAVRACLWHVDVQSGLHVGLLLGCPWHLTLTHSLSMHCCRDMRCRYRCLLLPQRPQGRPQVSAA